MQRLCLRRTIHVCSVQASWQSPESLAMTAHLSEIRFAPNSTANHSCGPAARPRHLLVRCQLQIAKLKSFPTAIVYQCDKRL